MPKTCEDYTADDMHNDYMRHRREGTVPCPASRAAWAKRQRAVRARLRKGSK